MNSETLVKIITRKLDELRTDLMNVEVEDSDREYSSFTTNDIARFIKDIAIEFEAADLLLKSSQVEKLAREISDQELDKYQTGIEELSGDDFKPSDDFVEERQGWQKLVGLCDEKILNAEAYVLDLNEQVTMFKANETVFYNLGIGHKIDNYLSRQNTQYRVFLICKDALTSSYSGIGDDFPSSNEFDSVFEEAKSRVLTNAKKYIDKHIKQLE